jgi:hypothetical protein
VTPRVEEAAADTQAHQNATMESRVVSGVVREDVDWRPALMDALRVCVDDRRSPQEKADAIDSAMMRAIHAGARTNAVHELGVQLYDHPNPLRRLAWNVYGQHRAAARARSFNDQQAARTAEEV